MSETAEQLKRCTELSTKIRKGMKQRHITYAMLARTLELRPNTVRDKLRLKTSSLPGIDWFESMLERVEGWGSE